MVTVYELEQELLKEQQALQRATVYRQQTAHLCLYVLKNVQDVTPFLTRTTATQMILNVLPQENLDRQQDVAKMLHVLTVQMNNEQQRSTMIQRKLAARKRQRGEVTLVKVI